MKRFLRIALALFLTVLVGCSEDSGVAGGPGSETTNGIYAQAILSDGSPAAFAKVALRKKDFISSDTSGALFTPDLYADSLGKIELPTVDSGDYRLTVSLGENIFSKELSVQSGALDLEQINLEAPGEISGTVLQDEKSASWVGVYGLDILTKTDTAGNFSLRGIPSGDLRVFILSGARDSVLADTSLSLIPSGKSLWSHRFASKNAARDTVKADTVETDTAGVDTVRADTVLWVLFENFEDSASFDEKGWYFSADTLSKILSPTDYAHNGLVADTARGNVFRGTYSTVTGSYVIFGTSVSKDGIDMSSLDSITFYARGNGSIRVSLERWEVSASDNLKAWTNDLGLSDDWKHYTVTPADFLSPDTDSLSTGWESVKKTVTRFHFFGVGGTELSFDDVAFYGVSF